MQESNINQNNQAKIKCPNCHQVFSVNKNDSGYIELLSQINDQELQKKLEEKESLWRANKDKDETNLKLALEQANAQNMYKLNEEIATLKAQLESINKNITNEKNMLVMEKDKEITELKNQLGNSEIKQQLAIKNASDKLREDFDRLKDEFIKKESDIQKLLTEKESTLREKDNEIMLLKDFKKKLSTKGMGEDLEQYCENEFNKYIMPNSKSSNIKFGKDNQAIKNDDETKGTKGDYIYREFVGEIEVVSIMFEMKNEDPNTQTKKKNSDHLDKLNKDRIKKSCKYAVLVSMLEQDNELYNGIYFCREYENMYIVRPQFFLSIISLLRNSEFNALGYKKLLEEERGKSVDIGNLEKNIAIFKEDFSTNAKRFTDHFNGTIEDIEKTIKKLEDIKKHLEQMNKNINIANDKLDDLKMKTLLKESPSLQKEYKMIESKKD